MPSTAKGMDKLGGNKVFIWGTGNYRLLVAILSANYGANHPLMSMVV